MYQVIRAFKERFDGDHQYAIGDTYPREGYTPPEGRAEALCVAKKTAQNSTGRVYLKYRRDEHVYVPEQSDAEPAAVPLNIDPEAHDFDAMTRAELLSYAKLYNVKGVTSRDSKESILAAVKRGR